MPQLGTDEVRLAALTSPAFLVPTALSNPSAAGSSDQPSMFAAASSFSSRAAPQVGWGVDCFFKGDICGAKKIGDPGWGCTPYLKVKYMCGAQNILVTLTYDISFKDSMI